jgi:hypothetical protein
MNTIKILDDDGFSIFGTKVFKYSDRDNSFFSAEDSGGFGERTTANLSYTDFCKNTDIIFLTDKLDYFAITRFDSKKRVVYSDSESSKFLDLIGHKIEIHNKAPRVWFPALVSETHLKHLLEKAVNSSEEISEALKNELIRSEFLHPDDEFWSSFVPVSFSSEKFDLMITFLGIPSRKINLKEIKIKYSADCMIIENKISIGDIWINGITVKSLFFGKNNYLNSLGLAHLYNQFSDTDREVQSVNSITLTGYKNGEEIPVEKFFVSFNKSLFIIHNGNINEPFAEINLLEDELSIDGTTEEFIISPNKELILKVSSDSREFIQSVFNSHEFQQAANRSSKYGPYVAENNHNLVRIDIENQDYLLTTNGANTARLDADIAERKLVIENNISKIYIQDYSLQATIPMLEATAAVLNSLTVRNQLIKNFDRNIQKLLGLEGLYFTYCVYGNIAKINLLINQSLEIQRLDEITNSNDKKDIFMKMIYASISYLINEFEKTLFYFPSFITKNDASLLSKVGVRNGINLSRCENAYTNSLRSNNAFVPHLAKIEGAFSRLTSVRRLKDRSDNLAKGAPLGVSAALSLANPIFLASAIQQGISLFNQKSDVSASESEIAERKFRHMHERMGSYCQVSASRIISKICSRSLP